ncbi:major facilitator superfamily domain-containing protein 6, partial [Aedes albopictus]|uniref:Major facilitator superfamily (MFS) profile domain-containing protein n=1 Tax=Aedes albopictus TaxID=7160 RepID=A0ABM1XVS9_AEDAL
GVDILVSSKLKHTQTRLSTNILRDVGQIFVSFKIVIYFCWCVLVGLGTALIWNFLFWHLEDLASLQEGCGHATWIKTLEGIVMSIQCFGGELPFFFLSGWILKKIGHIHAMSLVLLGFGVRFLLYSLLVDPWWVIPIEFMNGITFGLFYATMASYASIVAPPGTEATMQGLVGAVFEGVGVSLGSLLAGNLFFKVGGSATFRWFGIGALVLFFVHVIIQFVMEKLGSRDTNIAYTTPENAMHQLEDDQPIVPQLDK